MCAVEGYMQFRSPCIKKDTAELGESVQSTEES